MELTSTTNPFIGSLYEQINPSPKISPINYENATDFFDVDIHFINQLTASINAYLALELFPIYTSILAHRKQITPDYYPNDRSEHFYEISKYRDFQHFSLTAFLDKQTLISSHFICSLNQYIENFIKTQLKNKPFNEKNSSQMIHFFSTGFIQVVNNLSLKELFTLYSLPDESKKLSICEKRSDFYNRFRNEKQGLNAILKNVINDTTKFEKQIVIVSGDNVYSLDTKKIKNALKTEMDPVSAIQAHINIDPLLYYEKNDYLSIILIEPTPFKLNYDTVKIYKGITLSKQNGLFSISPQNLKHGLKRIKKHWIFRYFSL